jgi:WD40 repeat protein
MSYRAFISYSHAVDGKLAPAVQSALHRLAKPWYKLRAVAVFRDKTSLAANPALWKAIEAALAQSDYFLLMASPESARSPWVNREVQWWLDHRSVDRLLIVVTGGELVWASHDRDFDWERTSALPPLLRGRFEDEPLYVDLRWARDENDLSLRHSRFRAVVLDVAAPLHQRPKDELDGEDVRQYRRTRQIAWAAGTSLAALTVIASGSAYVAIRQRQLADERRIRAELGEKAARVTNLLATRPLEGLVLATEAIGQNLEELPAEVLSPIQSALLDAVQTAREKNVFQGHPMTSNTVIPQGHVHSVQFSPDGTQILSLGVEKSVRLWDLSGPLGGRLGSSIGSVRSAAFSPDSQVIATGGSDGYVRFWDRQGHLRAELLAHPGAEVTSVVFSVDSSQLIASSSSGRVAVCHTNGQRLGGAFAAYEEHATCAAFAPDSLVVTGGSDGTVRLWNLRGEAVRDPIPVHPGPVFSVIPSPDGRCLLSTDRDGNARLHTPDGKPQGKPFRPDGAGTRPSFAFSPNSRIIESYWLHPALGARYTLFDLNGEQVHNPFRGYEDQVRKLAFGPDPDYALTIGDDGALRLWKNYPHQLRFDPSGRPFGSLPARAETVAFSPDGNLIAAGCADSSVQVWDRFGNLVAGPFRGHQDRIGAIAFSPDGRYIASGSSDATVRLWEIDDGLVRQIGQHAGAVFGVAFRPDGSAVASAGARHSQGIPTVQVWSTSGKHLAGVFHGTDEPRLAAFAPTGDRIVALSRRGVMIWTESDELEVEFQADNASITCFTLLAEPARVLTGDSSGRLQFWTLDGKPLSSPQTVFPEEISAVAASLDGRRLVAASRDRTVRVLDLEAGQLRERFRIEDIVANSVDLSQDGKLVAAGSADGAVRLWDDTGRLLNPAIKAHSDKVTTVRINPRGNLIASGSMDQTIRLWDRRGNPVGAPLRSPRGAVLSVAFSLDGNLLASGGSGGDINLWLTGWKEWLAIACERLRHHPVLKSPEAATALRICQSYAQEPARR